MRIEGVQIEKERALAIAPRQPVESLLVHPRRRRPGRRLDGLLDLLPEHVEAAVEAELCRDHRARHEGSRLVALTLQNSGQRRKPRRQPVQPLVNAVAERCETGPQRNDARPGPRRGSRGFLEQHALAGERVEAWRGRPRPAVAAQPVRAQGVDEIEDDVRPRCRPGREIRVAASRQEDGRQYQEGARGAVHPMSLYPTAGEP